jgi:hypothetical protein
VYTILSSSKTSHVRGYIQNLDIAPFGMLLFSDLQLLIWKSIMKDNPILYFDSTGSILKSPSSETESKPFLYSLVAHCVELKKIIPIAEFLTTRHHQDNIASYLFRLKRLMAYEGKSLQPKIIVTDFSMALINSVMIAFNSSTLIEYLRWCFDYVTGGTSSMQTVHLLCSTHYLKSFMNKIKPIQRDESLKKFFTYCFTLLQNSVTLDTFSNYLQNIFYVFNTSNYNMNVKTCILFLNEALTIRNLKYDILIESFLEKDLSLADQSARDKTEPFQNRTISVTIPFIPNRTISVTIPLNSPFHYLFSNKIKEWIRRD